MSWEDICVGTVLWKCFDKDIPVFSQSEHFHSTVNSDSLPIANTLVHSTSVSTYRVAPRVSAIAEQQEEGARKMERDARV